MLTDAKKSSKILDVATGMGEQAFAFAKNGYTVIGIAYQKPCIRSQIKKDMKLKEKKH